MNTVVMEQRKKIHPHKFTLWVGIGSILMMFAGLTSAYIVKRNQANWLSFELPHWFWYSTGAIVLSSVCIMLAVRSLKKGEMAAYRGWVGSTLVLGVLFIVMQWMGFRELWAQGITLVGNVAYSFLFVIVGFHALHVLGGVIALLVLYVKILIGKADRSNAVPVQLAATYWHFVDLLWIYLMIFLLMIR